MEAFRESIENIVDAYRLKLLAYFGSYGTEDYRPESDIDLAYLTEEPLDTQQNST
ncbi:MAG: nucleotidyltransferase domain-containing protein [Firmicutes bacterium]|nr:nucleotidyltransferase domain-containing protein [Bacillota bacterium]